MSRYLRHHGGHTGPAAPEILAKWRRIFIPLKSHRHLGLWFPPSSLLLCSSQPEPLPMLRNREPLRRGPLAVEGGRILAASLPPTHLPTPLALAGCGLRWGGWVGGPWTTASVSYSSFQSSNLHAPVTEKCLCKCKPRNVDWEITRRLKK